MTPTEKRRLHRERRDQKNREFWAERNQKVQPLVSAPPRRRGRPADIPDLNACFELAHRRVRKFGGGGKALPRYICSCGHDYGQQLAVTACGLREHRPLQKGKKP